MVLKLSTNENDVFPYVLKLSFELSECKPLLDGLARVGGQLGLGVPPLSSPTPPTSPK